MRVHVRLFAVLRERAGTSELELDLPDGACVGDAVARVQGLAPELPLVMAVNREYAGADAVLAADDELALIPPVSGGAAPPVASAYARVTADPLSLDALLARVRDPRAGAVVTFSGVTREVEALEYEAYAAMAEPLIAEVVSSAMAAHGLCGAGAEHRVGRVELGEPSVLVAVSAPHRAEAFAGAREIIDRIKARAPIWKREVTREGTTWVSGTAPPTP